jgi:hypothetical protein
MGPGKNMRLTQNKPKKKKKKIGGVAQVVQGLFKSQCHE